MSQPLPDGPMDQSDLQEIASRQKAILLCILIYLIAVVSRFLVPPELHTILAAGVMVVAVVATVFVFLLATKLYGTGLGVVLGILTLIPLVGLIVLLVVNGKATTILKEHGIEVGLLGAKGPIG